MGFEKKSKVVKTQFSSVIENFTTSTVKKNVLFKIKNRTGRLNKEREIYLTSTIYLNNNRVDGIENQLIHILKMKNNKKN